VCVGSFPGRSSIVCDVLGKCLGMLWSYCNMAVREYAIYVHNMCIYAIYIICMLLSYIYIYWSNHV